VTPFRRRLAGACAATLAGAGLSGCGTVSSTLSAVNPFSSSPAPAAVGAAPAARAAVCPQAVILRPLANTVVLGSGETRRPTNVAFSGRLSEVDVKCDFAGGALRATFEVIVVAERGPAGRGNAVDFDYFVAVTGPDQSILSKKNFAVHIDIAPNAKRAAVTDHFDETINTGGQAPGDLTFNLGFQQSPAALEFYKTFRGS
jgi:hypothetical protein